MYNTAHLAHLLGTLAQPAKEVDNTTVLRVPCPLYSVPAAVLWQHRAVYNAWVNAFVPEQQLVSMIDGVIAQMNGEYNMVHVYGMEGGKN